MIISFQTLKKYTLSSLQKYFENILIIDNKLSSLTMNVANKYKQGSNRLNSPNTNFTNY